MATHGVTFRIPGEPVAKGRPRATIRGGKPATYTPQKTQTWEARAAQHMAEAMRGALQTKPFAGAVEMTVVAVWLCPKTDHRKRAPTPRRRRPQGADADNVLKAVCDAGNGVLYVDDRQVVRATVEKWTAAQDEAPYVEVTIRELGE